MEIEVYDFNKTIYSGDVTIDFYFFCVKRNPLLLRYFFYQLFYFLKYCLDMSTETECKEGLICFFKGIKDIEGEIQAFWITHENKIQDWYRAKTHDLDVIVTSVPEVIVLPVLEPFHVFKIIASKIEAETGKFLSLNCSGYEKVKRLNEEFPFETVEEETSSVKIKACYLHQLSDEPLASLAKTSYMVSKGKTNNWESYTLSNREKLEQIFLKKDFFVFLMY